MSILRTSLRAAVAGLVLASSAALRAQDPAPRPREAAVPEAPAAGFETLTRTLADKVVMTADLYRAPLPAEASAEAPPTPVLVCFHMTRSSRGEYRTLAPRFVERGFHVLAVDLRCGGPGEKGNRRTGERTGTMNETWKSARELFGREPSYVDAYPDIGAAVDWARELFPGARVGLVGSSYSASFVLVYAAENPSKVDAVVSFSPGEYMLPDFVVAEKVRKLTVPSYITSGNTAADMNQAKPVALAIESRERLITYWPEEHALLGDHGSRALHVEPEASRAKQWEMLDRALEPLKSSASPPKTDK